MTWLISDVNIIIDMEAGEILDKMFRLPETFAVPNVLYVEELETHHAQLGDVYKKPGHNDLLALALAKQVRCPLLTGDEKLREAAEREQVDVRGTLWVIERLFTERILDYQGVNDAYEKMKREMRRLPWDEIERQLKKMKL